jgi:murein DD-endopeptidase MepM/ murein hydrolase activator NlpD
MKLLPPVDIPYTGVWGHYPSGGTHKAVDYPVGVGTPVKAPDSGVVTTAGWSLTGFGKHVRIKLDSSGDTAILGHGSVLQVASGTRVGRGDIVMMSGNTGSLLPSGIWSTSGPHLHFEVRHSSWKPATAFDFTGSLGATQPQSLVAGSRRPVITVANIRSGKRNADVRLFNGLLWKAQGPVYKAKHLVAWMREKADLFGPVAQQVTFDTYAYLHKVNPAKWGPPPAKPAGPGEELVRHVGGDPR